MDSEEIRERRRKQNIKVFITGVLMVLSVALLLCFSTMMLLGYDINPLSEKEIIERTGLVAMRTSPAGASIFVDSEQMFAWTSTSKTMKEGTHEIIFRREGYEDFTKTINVKAGLLYRLNYPRLLPKNISSETVADFSNITMYSVAPDENTMLAMDAKGNFIVYKINETSLSGKAVDFSKILVKDFDVKDFSVVSWSGNSKRLIAKIAEEYIMMDISNPAMSVNLSEKYGALSSVNFQNDAGSKVFFLLKNTLYEAILADVVGEMTALAVGVVSYYNLVDEAVVVSKNATSNSTVVGLVKSGETEMKELIKYPSVKDEDVTVVLSRYYGDDYLAVMMDNELSVYKGTLPSSEERFIETMEKVEDRHKLEFKPASMEVWVEGGAIVLADSDGKSFVVFDVEREGVVKFSAESKMRFVDENMMYGIYEGGLVVMDFDGLNKRTVIENGVDAKGEVRVSRNDKWLYYLSADGKLMRAVILL